MERLKRLSCQKNFCMNKIATWLSILSLVLIGLLYYFHFTHVDFSKFKFVRTADTTKGTFRMAYFDMDSVDQNYEYAKFIRENLKKKEEQLNMQMAEMKKGFQKQMNDEV